MIDHLILNKTLVLQCSCCRNTVSKTVTKQRARGEFKGIALPVLASSSQSSPFTHGGAKQLHRPSTTGDLHAVAFP
jgi:hypothetical protein